MTENSNGSSPAASGDVGSTPNDQNTKQGEGQNLTPAQKRKFKFEVDGQAQEYEFDDNEVHARLQKSLAAEKRLKEANEIKSKSESIINKIKTKPWDALKEAGMDPYEAASKYVVEQFEYSQLSPEAKRLKELEEENMTFKQREEKRKFEERAAKLKAKYDIELAELLKKNKRLEKPKVKEEFLKNFIQDHENYDGDGDDAPSLIPYHDEYTKKFVSNVKDYLLDLSPDELSVVLDDAVMVKIKEHLMKGTKLPTTPATQKEKSEKEKAASNPTSWEEAFSKF
ncbi:MAG: hypothetical protein E6R04_03245 [Spirochaetes bacterium]|nr:MAG: hypothetical protein E6R04_03245 [Spirochaetota bacterium]